jgi:hypothetical protein
MNENNLLIFLSAKRGLLTRDTEKRQPLAQPTDSLRQPLVDQIGRILREMQLGKHK